MTPQLYDGTVLISTIPGNVKSFYKGNGDGIVWALDAATGKPKWTFNTVSDGAGLWGNRKINSGGGLWYPPAVDVRDGCSSAVANPAPLYGTKEYPNGSSRPGPNLYTNSIVALDGKTGKRLWFRQAVRHDVRDYDLAGLAAIVDHSADPRHRHGDRDRRPARWARSTPTARRRSAALEASRSAGTRTTPGRAARGRSRSSPAISAASRRRWRSTRPRSSCRGSTWRSPPARPVRQRAHGPELHKGRGGSPRSTPPAGGVMWQRRLPSMDFGAATVANDVVFTSTYEGKIYAFDVQTGKTLWTKQAPAGINSFPAVDGDTLLVGAAAPGFVKKPRFQLIAYASADRR